MTIALDTLHRQRLSEINWPIPSPLGALQPFHKQNNTQPSIRKPKSSLGSEPELLNSIEDVFAAFEIKDGSTISFHHHYRNGDRLLNAVCDIAAEKGLVGLTLAASSLFPVHAPIIAHIRSGVIANIITDYVKGPVADEISAKSLSGVAILQTHGGRARAITTGELTIDVAFVGASIANRDGSASGRGGKVPCGPLGYARVDAEHAKKTVVLAHEIVDHPLDLVDIPAQFVDALVRFNFPGDIEGIASDTTIPSTTQRAATIGKLVAEVVSAAGLLKDGLSLQSGAGGYSLASVPILGRRISEQQLSGSFLAGGITGAHVDMLEAGLFSEIRDVQCFDNAAVQSSIYNSAHHMMNASEYANPLHSSPAVNDLSVMLLGAVEIDQNFNVNVTVGGNGKIIGGPGGHPDTAAGAKLSIVTTGLTGGGYPKLTRSVRSITTPGEDIDVLITEAGIAVNPRIPDLLQDLQRANLPLFSFEELQTLADAQCEHEELPSASNSPCAFIEHRNGGILDWI